MLVDFLIGASPYSAENQAFWMAIQGAMAVRKGPNQGRRLQWFHAFILSILAGYGGGLMGFVWMGKPSSMLSNDLAMGSCILAFVLVNYTPYNAGYMVLDSLPVTLVTTSFAQLFRAIGVMRFVSVCFHEFKDNPSPYYPIPVFGPIIYGTLLGNMGSFFLKGLEGHVAHGMPWPFQNGLFCGTFYHFFVHDKKGPIGELLRAIFPRVLRFGLNDATFAAVVVSLFMQIVGILQLPFFLGPTFSPFGTILSPWKDSSTWSVGKQSSMYSNRQQAKQQIKRNKRKKKM